MEASEVVARLRRYFDDGRSHTCLEQVRNQTGYATKERTADLIAFGCWPSQGLEIHGVEVKVNRSDWLKELKDGSKAEAVARYCDRWWIAVGDPEIVKAGELPRGWGLLVPKGDDSMRAKKKAPPQEEVVPLDRPFVASVMRSARKEVQPGALQEAFDNGFAEGRKQGFEAGVQNHYADRSRLVERLKDAEGELEQIRLALGENGTRLLFNSSDFAAAVRVLMEARSRGDKWLSTRAKNLGDDLEKRLADLRRLERSLGRLDLESLFADATPAAAAAP